MDLSGDGRIDTGFIFFYNEVRLHKEKKKKRSEPGVGAAGAVRWARKKDSSRESTVGSSTGCLECRAADERWSSDRFAICAAGNQTVLFEQRKMNRSFARKIPPRSEREDA